MEIYRHFITSALLFFLFYSCQMKPEELFALNSKENRDFEQVPISMVVDDFNNDGNIDIALSEIRPSRLKIMYAPGNESGNLNQPIELPIGHEPRKIYSSDINNDSYPDLFALNYFDNQIELKINDGTGNFTPSVFFETGTNPIDLEILNIDSTNDNFLDIIVLSQHSRSIEIYTGDNLGGFSQINSYPVGFLPQALEVGDINNDGFIDFLVANFNDQNISIYVGDGAGAFTPLPDFSVPNFPGDIKLGDFNEDGLIDLAVALVQDDEIRIYQGDGLGGFDPTELHIIATNTRPYRLFLDQRRLDRNSIGELSLIVSYWENTNISYFSGLGDGTFSPGSNTELGDQVADLATTDFDQDGELDVLILGESLSSLLVARGTGNLPLNFSGLSSVSIGENSLKIIAQDLNADGFEDVAAVSLNEERTNILFGNGNGSFGSTLQCNNQEFPVDLNIMDYNTDGLLDFMTINKGSISFTLCDAMGALPTFTLDTEVHFPTRFRGRPLAIESSDFTGDTLIDVAVLNESTRTISLFTRQIGPNPYPSRTETTLPDYPIDMERADIDQDGDLDLLVSFQDNYFIAYLNNGSGVFSGSPAFSSPRKMTNFILRDVNGDSEPDIITASRNENTLSVAFGNAGIGNFTYSNFQNISLPCSPYSISTGFVDTDLFADIAITCNDNSQIYVYQNDTAGFFNIFSQYTLPSNTTSTAIADFNGDSIGDLIISYKNQANGNILLSEPQSGFSGIGVLSLPAGTTTLNSNNLNSGIALDLIALNSTSVNVALGNNDGTFSAFTSYPVTPNANDFTSLDFDGDGNQDIVVASNNTSFTSFQGSATGLLTDLGVSNYPSGNNQSLIGINANNDGDDDIILTFQSPTTFFTTYLSNGVTPYLSPPSASVINTPLPAGCSSFDITSLNYNGDANNDLAITCDSGTRLITYTGNGLGNFTLDIDINTLASDAREVIASDLDNDSDTDLLISLEGGGIQVLEYGSGTFNPLTPQFHEPLFHDNDHFRKIQQVDINGDVFADFYMIDNFSNEIVRLVGSNTNSFIKQEISIQGPLADQTIIDFDSDGDQDIITVREGSDEAIIRNIGQRPGLRSNYPGSPQSFYFGD